MSTFVNRFTKNRIHFAVGLSVLVRAMQDTYKELSGSLLEGIARLFRLNVRLSVFPMSEADLREWLETFSFSGWEWQASEGLVHASKLRPAGPLYFLHQYLMACKFIVPMPPTKD